MPTYPGGKNSSFHHVINEIPPHRVYAEPFLGSGAIFLNKRRAPFSILSDVDPAVISAARSCTAFSGEGISLEISCVHSLFSKLPPGPDVVVYCDPPYHPSTRSKFPMYTFELSDSGHLAFLNDARSLNNNVLISGYRCDLYDSMLSDWRRVDYTAATRQGSAQGSLWCNFDKPTSLHDYSFLGFDFREREAISRQQRRWRARLANLPILERKAILEKLNAPYL